MIKTMNSKIITNLQLSTTESKKQKHMKQTTRTGTGTEMEITWRIISGKGEWG